MKNIMSVFLVCHLFLPLFILSGCSDDQSKKSISLNETRKTREQRTVRVSGYHGSRKPAQQPPLEGKETIALEPVQSPSVEQRTARRGARKQAEDCQKEFERCTENCQKSSCENACLNYLSECEAELPKEFQTLKK